jgi:hypothetical protein
MYKILDNLTETVFDKTFQSIEDAMDSPIWALTANPTVIKADDIPKPQKNDGISSHEWSIVYKGTILGLAQAITARDWALKKQLLSIRDDAKHKADPVISGIFGAPPRPDRSIRIINGLFALVESATPADMAKALKIVDEDHRSYLAWKQSQRR